VGRKRLLACIVLVCTAFLWSSAAWGQAGTSTIRGEVLDPQSAAIPKATVTITNPTTGFTRTQTTTAAGVFSFELIPPAKYTVTVEATGFQKRVMSNVSALVGAPTDLHIEMKLGSMQQVVQVQATATSVAINTQDASLGNNFESEQITQLPIEARNVNSLLTLQPGVTPTGYVAGARSDQSNVTLDGVDINEAQDNSLNVDPTTGLGGPVLRLNQDAIEEFRVTTLDPNSNMGRSSGAQVNLVTRGGTNSFHGDVFEYHRNTIFTANDFFNNRSGIERPKLIRNTFGAAVGGPILHNRVFFFFSYEGRRDASGTSVVQVVPLPILGQGEMRYTDPNGNPHTLTTAQLNQIFPDVGLNPVAIQALADAAQKYPANDYTVGDSNANRLLNTAGYRFNASTPVHLNSSVARLDWRINQKQSVFVRVNVIDDHRAQPSQFPDTPAPQIWSHPTGLVASHTWTLGNNWVNNFRYGLTREAFSRTGDSGQNGIWFRFIFQPYAFSRTLSRTTPVHNFVDDVSWVKGSHTIQFGGNIRKIDNGRTSYGNAYDNAITNPSFYAQAGAVVSEAIVNYLSANSLPDLGSESGAQNAATALIGRFTQYTANFTFGADGSLLSSGSPTIRTFATQGYDVYMQDVWQMRHNFTLTYGVRYSIERPVYETKGFEVKPDVGLGNYLQNRAISAAAGVIYNVPITLQLSGPANGQSPMYPWDTNNFQPRVAVAWQPNFERGFLHKVFGAPGQSVIRGGFAMSNDYFGQQLAVAFDLNNTLGFTSNYTTPANTFNVTNRPGPLFQNYGQDVRSLLSNPVVNVQPPTSVTFPQQQPMDFARRIEDSLDSNLHAPKEYTWNLTYGRELPGKMTLQLSYIGRVAHDLLATRDTMALENLVDPKSGMDWYTAATMLEKIRQAGQPADAAVTPIPYFENIFPADLATQINNYYECACVPSNFTPTQTWFWIANNFYGNDWTDIQNDVEYATGIPYFFQSQYGALSAWGTIAHSNYQGLAVSLRQRLGSTLMWDFNYTYSHSLDNASGLQTSGGYDSAFILNPFRPNDNYGSSDFDLRHVININGIYQMPFGRGKAFAGTAPGWLDAIIGGWQLSGIFRWNTGLPQWTPYDSNRWATNWEVQSNTTQVTPVKTCVTRGDANTAPKLFGCDTVAAYQSFRNAYPGETGQRNVFRLPGYISLDAGLSKSFTMPWSDKQKLSLKWEVFNVTNTQHFGAMDTSRTGYGLQLDPALNNTQPPPNWSNFTGIQGSPRVMQIGARFSF
jgi:hypothetical protein